jgi:hypothetical protein
MNGAQLFPGSSEEKQILRCAKDDKSYGQYQGFALTSGFGLVGG